MHLILANNSAAGAVKGSFESIASATGTGSSGTITFNNIPSTYQHLQIRWIARNTDTGSGFKETFIRFNNSSTAVYDYHGLYGDGASVNASAEVSVGGANGMIGWATSENNTANRMAVGIIDIHDYASTTKNKTVRAFTGQDLNGSGRVMLISNGWRNTNAITRIDLITQSNNFTTNTQFALYGIKGV